MSRNEVSDNLISQYLEPQKKELTSLKSLHNTKRSGQSLKDFYREVQTQKNTYAIKNIYNGKSAVEIEIMMMQNRRLIEANHTKR